VDKTLITGLISSVVAIGAAAIAVWGQLRVKRIEAQLELQKAEAGRRAETQQTARRFREPLGRAAYELQSRIFNIVRGGFLTVYWKGGDDRTRAYAINHTLFVIAQYFAWTELIRREIQFIDWAQTGRHANSRSFSTRSTQRGKPTNTSRFFAYSVVSNTQSASG
jgi:hypothetical protein